ncbi:Hypothetical protein UVM_LOCUS147, partial [uncultured virus]
VRDRQDEEDAKDDRAQPTVLRRPLAERAREIERVARHAREIVGSWARLNRERLEKNPSDNGDPCWARECRIERTSAALLQRLEAALGDDLERRVLATASRARNELTVLEEHAPLADDGIALDFAERSEAFSIAYKRCQARLYERYGPGLQLLSDTSADECSGTSGRVRLFVAW